MRGGGGGPVGVKCCAANSNLPPRRADPHAEGKTLWVFLLYKVHGHVRSEINKLHSLFPGGQVSRRAVS